MRVFIHLNNDQGYRSFNFVVAAEGFRELGWEVVGYEDVAEILPQLEREDIVVDFMRQSDRALAHLGVAPPRLPTYPEALRGFLGREIWLSTINAVAARPELWPVFVKPREETKKFTGVLVRGTRDLIGCGDPESDTPVWCSAPVRLLREWRCFIRYGEVVDVRPYKGDWRGHYDHRVIEAALSAWADQPRGCALDFGLDDQGRTLLIEANDGFSLGSYGLPPRDYARLLSARWTELTGTRDWCEF